MPSRGVNRDPPIPVSTREILRTFFPALVCGKGSRRTLVRTRKKPGRRCSNGDPANSPVKGRSNPGLGSGSRSAIATDLVCRGDTPPSPTVYILDVKRSESSRHGPDLPFMEALPSRYLNTSGENFPHPSGGNSRRVSRGRRSDRNPSTMETSPTWSTRSGSPHPDPLQGIFNAHLPVVDLPNKPFPTRRSETNPSAVSGTCTVSPSWSRKTGASIHHVKCIAAGKTLPIGRVRNLPGVITSGDGSTIVTSRYRAIGSSVPSPATTKHGRTSGHGSDF